MCLVEDILAKDVKIVDGMAVAAIMVWRRGSRAFLAESGNVEAQNRLSGNAYGIAPCQR